MNQPLEQFTVERIAYGGDGWDVVRRIRDEVFVVEQQCPPVEEWDAYEAGSIHLLGRLNGTPAACSRWREYEHDGERAAKLERFAVLAPFRGRGIGRAMIRQTIDHAREAGHTAFVLHAQAHLERLYASFGFERKGEVFREAGIPHVFMHRQG